jgi:hypothetical protein
MERPRLLLVPMLTELEWVIKPQLEEWAEVASYDAPGVGTEPPVDEPGSRATARRGIEEVDRLGWDSFVVAADEFGVVAASHLAATAGKRVAGVALGHARLSNSTDGPSPAVNQEVMHGVQSMIRTDNRMFVQQLFKMTRGAAREGGYQEDLVDEYVRRVPLALTRLFYETRTDEGAGLGDRLARLDVPMMLAQHKDCVLFTNEGFEAASAAFPQARVTGYYDKPSTSPEFSADLRDFCGSLVAAHSA